MAFSFSSPPPLFFFCPLPPHSSMNNGNDSVVMEANTCRDKTAYLCYGQQSCTPKTCIFRGRQFDRIHKEVFSRDARFLLIPRRWWSALCSYVHSQQASQAHIGNKLKMRENGTALHSVQHEWGLPGFFFAVVVVIMQVVYLKLDSTVTSCISVRNRMKKRCLQKKNKLLQLHTYYSTFWTHCYTRYYIANMLARSCEFWDFLCSSKLFKSSARFSFSVYSL